MSSQPSSPTPQEKRALLFFRLFLGSLIFVFFAGFYWSQFYNNKAVTTERNWRLVTPLERPPLPLDVEVLLKKTRKKNQTITYINYWAYWCEPCLKEIPLLAQIQQQYPRVQFILYNLDTGSLIAQARNFLSKTAPQFTFQRHPLAIKISKQVGRLPYHQLIDRNRKLALSTTTTLHQPEFLTEALEQLLKE